MEVRVRHKDKLYKGKFYPIGMAALKESFANIQSDHFLQASFSTYKWSPRRLARVKGYPQMRDSQFDVLRFTYNPGPVKLSAHKGSTLQDDSSDYTPCDVCVMAVDEAVLHVVRESLDSGGMDKITEWLSDTLSSGDALRRFELVVTCDGKLVEYLTFEK